MFGDLVSIITICKNSEKTIERTIKSVISQTYRTIEYIVIDGYSHDGTLDIIDKYSSYIDIVVSEDDQGIYDAMNKGIKRASGKWIHILNSDDYYESSESLDKAMRVIEDNKTNYFEMIREFPNTKRKIQSWNYRRKLLFISAYMPHPAMIVASSQYKCVGLYATNFKIASDHDMVLKLTELWPGKLHKQILTVMSQGGYSERLAEDSLEEFRQITVTHGLNIYMSYCVRWLKRIYWLFASIAKGIITRP